MTTAVTNNTTTTNTTSTSSTSSTSDARTSLATNFQTFLTLLTTQLQNQDPTSPMDSNQFTQQLVEYSQVEQQIDTNSKLDSLVALSSSQSTNLAMSYLGKNVVLSDGSGQLASGKADWTYGLANAANATTLTVKNANGDVVYSKTADASGDTAGTHDFAWDGTKTNGETASDGLYTLTVSSSASDGTAITTTVASKATVSGVDLSGSSPKLVIGSSEVALSSATLVTN
jgi:flagellar basal-body rod modification protein FlgD